MALTLPQSTSSRTIPAEGWNKMSRAEKREFFREQRILARERKPKEGESEGDKITVDSSTTVDTTAIPDQKPTAILSSRHDNQPDNQGSVSSASGYGVEESKEEAPDEEIAICIKRSKSTSSSQYGSHANESAFLQTTRAGYDLMGQLMTDMVVTVKNIS